jgi:hypothetical protein
MTQTPCYECGTAVPPHSQACPQCGAPMAPVSPAAYRPLPPRPPEPPERRWLTIAGWVAVAAVGALVVLFFFRVSTEADRRATEKAEMTREAEHLSALSAWLQDTSANAPVPGGAGRPVPTTERAKWAWVIGRMFLDRSLWEREVMERHGAKSRVPPAAWMTARYQADARAYPQVGRYLEGRVAAIAEIEKGAAAWLEERTAALARESGLPARETRDIFPSFFGNTAVDEARMANAMLEIHRHLVRVDSRVHHAGGDWLRWERDEDRHRFEGLVAKLNDAVAYGNQARRQRLVTERAALSRVIQ